MATPDPEHFFDQADRLIEASAAGAPRQVDLRRAVSAAYYGIFHAVTTAVADLFVTAAKRRSPIYTLVYRSIKHQEIKKLCEDLAKPRLPQRYGNYVPEGGLGDEIRAFASAFVDLQERRHEADYNPGISLRRSDAKFAVNRARSALQQLRAAPLESIDTFSTLLVFPPRLP